MRIVVIVTMSLSVAQCTGYSSKTPLPDPANGAQAISLLGDTLFPPDQPEAVRSGHEARLAAARDAYDANPQDADALVWYGRRTAYLGNYREAIRIYTRGIDEHPTDARMYRHRGHRYISVRDFDRAIQDFERAADLIRGQADEVEPDGLPNARNIPTSTLQFNIWYHLGLARYLNGDVDGALQAYRECLEVSLNPDALVATSYWLYMTLRRLEQDEAAAAVLEPITADMDIIENHSYQRLLLLNKGVLSPEDLLDTSGEDDVPLASATVGYGIGNWHAYNGRLAEAEAVWRQVLNGSQWAAFGYIAAEADVARH